MPFSVTWTISMPKLSDSIAALFVQPERLADVQERALCYYRSPLPLADRQSPTPRLAVANAVPHAIPPPFPPSHHVPWNHSSHCFLLPEKRRPDRARRVLEAGVLLPPHGGDEGVKCARALLEHSQNISRYHVLPPHVARSFCRDCLYVLVLVLFVFVGVSSPSSFRLDASLNSQSE